MSHTVIPPLRTLPGNRLAERKEHLLNEMGRGHSRTAKSRLGLHLSASILLAGLVAMAGVVSVSASIGRTGQKAGSLPVNVYSYDQAVQAGLVPSMATIEQQTGLPECPPPSVNSGPTVVPPDHIGDPATCIASSAGMTFVRIPAADFVKYGATAYGIYKPPLTK